MDKLAEFRAAVDAVDEKIITLLGERYAICRNVARLKKQQNIPMMQPGRVQAVLERCSGLALSHNVDPEFIVSLYRLIIDEACRIEDKIIEAHD